MEDTAGTLTLDYTEVGAATSPTVILLKPDGSTLQSSTAATADTTSTTLAAPVAVGATTLTVASATGIVAGRSYVVSNTGGQYEEFRVKSVVSTTVTVFEAFEYAYDTSDPVFGRRLTYTATTAHTADRDRGYRAKWTYTVGGAEYRTQTLFDVVRNKWPDIIVTPQDFKAIAGDLGDDIMQTVDQQGADFATAVAEATKEVRDRIRLNGLEVDLFYDWEPFKRPVVMRVILSWAEQGWQPRDWDDGNRSYIERREQLFLRAFEEALEINDAYDADDSDAVTDDEETASHGAVRFQL